jgi:hypothetical protein
MGFSSFWFLDSQNFKIWRPIKGVKPGGEPSPPETLKKAGAAEQVRDINDLRKKCRSRPGADSEQCRSSAGAVLRFSKVRAAGRFARDTRDARDVRDARDE